MKFFNRVRVFSTTSSGAVAASLSVALGTAYNQTFLTAAEAGAVSTDVTSFLIEQGTDFALCTGTVGASATSIVVASVLKTKVGGTVGGTLTLDGTQDIRFVESAEDLNALATLASPSFTGAVTITGNSASTLAVGRLGATTPALQVDASTATSITGVKVKSAASGGGVAVSAIGETNVALTIDAAGSGAIDIGTTSTGAIGLKRNTSVTGTLGVSGVLSANDTTEASGASTGALVVAGGINAAKAIKSNSTTASISVSTGSGIFGGGIGVAGKGFFGSTITSTVVATTGAVAFEASATFAVASGAQNYLVASGNFYGLMYFGDPSLTGAGALWICANGSASLIGQVSGVSTWVASTTTPAAGKYSLAHDGTNWRVYTNAASSTNFSLAAIKIV
jgi:hypothetical protein